MRKKLHASAQSGTHNLFVLRLYGQVWSHSVRVEGEILQNIFPYKHRFSGHRRFLQNFYAYKGRNEMRNMCL